MKITDALIEVGSAGAGLLAAQTAENKFSGYVGPGASLAAGGAALYLGPKWMKPAGAVMVGYALMSAGKKLAFPADSRATGLLAEVQDALPGNLLGAGSMSGLRGLAESFEDFADDFDEDITLMGMGNLDESLAGIEDALAGADGNMDLSNSLT